MLGALLRSGKTDSFTALGETGRPVYRAALQLREAIKRKHPGVADHFAIPQSNQVGDHIDWYAPYEGDVIPWTAATEDERAPARATLEEVRATLKLMSVNLLDAANGEAQGDRQVLARLLMRVMNFPDETFVYLVAGRPVITFWGFDHHRAPLNRNPLQCLYPAAIPPAPAAPLAPFVVSVEPPLPVTPTVAAPPRPWWHWLLLSVLLALLLALLLFGLRACGPRVGINIPGFTLPDTPYSSVPDTTLRQPVPLAPGVGQAGVALAPAAGGGILAPGHVPAPGAGTPPSPSGVPPLVEPGADTNVPTTPDPAKADPAALASPGLPPPDGTPPNGTPPTLPPEQAAASTPGNPLSMPPGQPDGAANFLNGKWRAGAGIQDTRTGQPLRLEYQFHDGKGNVTVQRGDGVACSAPVAATMKDGSLAMTSAEQATCGDGGKYDMPQVACKPGAQSIAECTGTYGKDQFPLSMRQASK